MKSGAIYAILAYTMWGLLPLYWKIFASMSSWEVLAHRVIWSFVFVSILLILKSRWKEIKETLKDRRITLFVTISSLLISVNWLTYIWAVNNSHVIEASLGYYINPLINVLLGVLFLSERPRLGQWIAIFFAFCGVMILTLNYGKVPWIALILALTFGFYGLVKKKIKLGPLLGLSLETIIVFPIALFYLSFLFIAEKDTVQTLSTLRIIALLLAGVATATPLLWFAQAAKRLPLSTMAFFQYLSPTISLILGILVFKESFTQTELISFSFIWLALVFYTWTSMKRKKPAADPSIVQQQNM